MLKFPGQTFYQPLFNNSLSAILFPSAVFSLPKVSHTKRPQSQKPKAKAKNLMSSFSQSFIPSSKHGGAAVLREERDIVTEETCVP
jgi:hypothetical protein